MYRYVHTVQYYETDRMGVAHHSNHIRWMEEARVSWLEALGWSYARLEESGIVSPVTAVECRYKSSCTFSDAVTVTVSMASFDGVTLKVDYRMEGEDGKLICQARSEHVFLNRQGRFIRLKRDYSEFYACLMREVEEVQ